MRRTVLAALWSHWRRNPLQLFTLLAGLALATALWSGVQAINAEARASYDAAAATLGEGRFDQLTARDGGTIPQETYIALRRAGWLVSPVVEGRIDGADSDVRLIGIDPLTAPGDISPAALDGGAIPDFLGGGGQIYARAETLALLRGTGAALIETPDAAPGTALTDIGLAQGLLGMEGRLTRLIVAPVQPSRQLPLGDVAPDLLRTPAQGGSDIGRLTDSFHLNLTAFGLLSFAVGIFIVNGAIGLAFEQRRAVVRTMRALGVPLRSMVTLIVVELAVFALIAGTVGVAIGYVIAAALLPDVAATLRGLYGADVGGTLTLRPGLWLSGLAIALGGTGIAAAGALWRLARAPLLAAAQPRAWAMGAGTTRRVMALASVSLLIVAVLFATFGSGIVAGFGLLACLLIGAALALPLLLSAVLAVAAGRAKGAISEWFWADTRQQLPGLSLALMALLLAMAANVGVSTMVSSFRLTFTGFLDQRLASELYINASDADEAARLEAFVAPRVRAVLPLVSVPGEVAGLPSAIYGARDDVTYRDNWLFLSEAPAAWDALFAGDAAIVNEQLARRAGLAVGDEVTVAPGLTLPIAGVFGDYGNPIGQVILGEALFAQTFPSAQATGFGLRLPPEDVPALRRALEEEFGLPAAAAIDQAAVKALSLDIFDRTFTVTTALNILTLAVAGFAILMSLLTLAALRLPQLAPVWALGMTRASLGRYELARAVLLALLTAVFALPLGLALAWVLLAVVNVEAFGWRLPMFLFPGDYARLLVFALIAAALAALWPARRLARTPPAVLLKVFSNER